MLILVATDVILYMLLADPGGGEVIQPWPPLWF